MSVLRIDSMMGMAPKISNRLLPDTAASLARNARLRSGELRGIEYPAVVFQFPLTGNIQTAYRLVKNDETEVWMGFEKLDVDVVRGPLVNDSLERYYWTGDEDFVAYNTADDIELGAAKFRLGTPGPNNNFVVSAAGGTGPSVTRSYVFTFVNEYGEESAPAFAQTVTGNEDGTWDLSSMQTAPPDMTNRVPIEFKRIYRTVTGRTTAEFYLVDEIGGALTTYSDTKPDTEVVQNVLLQSYDWTPPPDELFGLIAHPNGFLAGFVGRDLYLSIPYRPHAWPQQFVLTTEQEIVGLAVYNNMLMAMTKSRPYFIPGSDPRNLALQEAPNIEPCLNKGSIASTLDGVLYASQNGLVLFNESGCKVTTNQIMSNTEWFRYSPQSMRAGQSGNQYVAWYSPNNGIKYSPDERLGVFSELDRFEGVENVVTDWRTGDIWIIRNNTVYEWQPPNGVPLYYTWESKEFDHPRPLNYAAVIVKMKESPSLVPQSVIDDAETWNTARIDEAPLNPLNFTTINGVVEVPNMPIIDSTEISEGGVVPQTRYPLGGGPLFNIAQLSGATETVQLRVTVDGVVRYAKNVIPNKIMRLPSGFKGQVWQFALTGNAQVYSMAFATTGRELMNV